MPRPSPISIRVEYSHSMPQDQVSAQAAVTERRLQTTAYRSESSLSREFYQRATKVMPGGNTRHSTVLSPYTIYVSRGQGCRVTDVEGQQRIDFLNNHTSLILGHADRVPFIPLY